MNRTKTAILMRAAEFYARSPDGQYDDVAREAINRWIRQRLHRRLKAHGIAQKIGDVVAE